jgi:hypothetical protein
VTVERNIDTNCIARVSCWVCLKKPFVSICDIACRLYSFFENPGIVRFYYRIFPGHISFTDRLQRQNNLGRKRVSTSNKMLYIYIAWIGKGYN